MSSIIISYFHPNYHPNTPTKTEHSPSRPNICTPKNESLSLKPNVHHAKRPPLRRKCSIIKNMNNPKAKTYLITGGAGFIGSTLAERLLREGNRVVVVDNFCDYYNPALKEKNAADLAAVAAEAANSAEATNSAEAANSAASTETADSAATDNFKLYRADIRDAAAMKAIFAENAIDVLVHLAAMAGVRPSIEDPLYYQQVNGDGTQILLECAKAAGLKNLVMASSSSVYGNCKETPFNEKMIVDFAISPYAATKKANEVMAHVYHHLNDMNIIMLRFFTVYGPKQRPDLAINKFTRLMLAGEKIPMFGDGTTARDYTFVDDIVDGIIRSADYVSTHDHVYEILNLGNNSPVNLRDMISTIGNALNIEPVIEQLPMQPGDVEITYADITKAQSLIGYNPKTSFADGIKKFVDWYRATQA